MGDRARNSYSWVKLKGLKSGLGGEFEEEETDEALRS